MAKLSKLKAGVTGQDQEQPLRIGFIGAGSIAASRHLPNLAKIDGVQVVVVANRTIESAKAVATKWDIPDVMDDWEKLVAREDLDAVFIGTWPYTHKTMSIAALESGKHVFCQARMAMDLQEAKAMTQAAAAHPNLVNMICPPPTRMPFEPYIKQMMAHGELGPITGVQLVCLDGSGLDRNNVSWREEVRYSGRQIMAVGIFAETLNAWVGPYDTLTALTDTPIRKKKNAQGQDVDIQIPQIVQIQGRLRGGVPIQEYHSGLVTDESMHLYQLTIWGLDGALRYKFGKTIEYAKAGSPFKTASVPAKLQREWQVEKDFITAVRKAKDGQKWKVSPDFTEGLLYMRKMEAVYESARTGQRVELGTL